MPITVKFSSKDSEHTRLIFLYLSTENLLWYIQDFEIQNTPVGYFIYLYRNSSVLYWRPEIQNTTVRYFIFYVCLPKIFSNIFKTSWFKTHQLVILYFSTEILLYYIQDFEIQNSSLLYWRPEIQNISGGYLISVYRNSLMYSRLRYSEHISGIFLYLSIKILVSNMFVSIFSRQ